jgi:small subunit ribosomal protein S16
VLVIRLTRIGARKKPRYRVVVMEKERARDGRPVETVGHYNPMTKPSTVELDRVRIDYWVSKGAQPSDTVRGLMKFSAATPSPSGVPAPEPVAA